MILKRLKLHNYRNYQSSEYEFGRRTTVLIGKNGMGKTNLMAALHQVLSFIFARIQSAPQYKFLASSDQRVVSYGATDAYYSNKISDYSYPIQLHAEGVLPNGAGLEWDFLQMSESAGLKNSLYSDAHNLFWLYYWTHQNELPLLVFYSDSYPHVRSNVGTKMQEKLDSGMPLPANTAYYKWDDERNCTDIWVQYFIMQKKNAFYSTGKKTNHYVQAIEEKMVEFSQPMLENVNTELRLSELRLEARGKRDVLVYVFANGTRCPADQLPQGYKRLFSIAFDLASRSYMLCKHCNASGIVLIDEIELHLHPSLAQEILPRLQRAFPNIQFIVTTHSPLVLTRLHPDDDHFLYRLTKSAEGMEHELLTEDYYGADANVILENAMEADHRSTDVQQAMDKVQACINRKDVPQAKLALAQLKGITNANHLAVVRMESLINRLEIIGR